MNYSISSESLQEFFLNVQKYRNKEGWNILVKRAMECDNSWAKSAGEYIRMYNELVKNG